MELLPGFEPGTSSLPRNISHFIIPVFACYSLISPDICNICAYIKGHTKLTQATVTNKLLTKS